MKKLKLETDYKVNGNSTGMAIDTLAIAVSGGDSNDFEDWGGDHETQKYVLEHYNYEDAMLKEATKAQLKEWLHNPQAQAEALEEYTQNRKEGIYTGEDTDSELAEEIEEALQEYHDEQYHEWIYGDRRNWAGILGTAEQKYGRHDIKFDHKNGEVYAEISEDIINDWKAEGSIDRKNQAYKYLENRINNDAGAEHDKKIREREERKKERERLQAYKAKQAEEAEVERQKKLKKLIKTK